jgi:hypothetical protein
MFLLLFSTKTAPAAPRLNASMPIFPVPAYRSRKLQFGRKLPSILKSASLTLSDVGLTSNPRGAFSLRFFAKPEITRRMKIPSFNLIL